MALFMFAILYEIKGIAKNSKNNSEYRGGFDIVNIDSLDGL